MVRELARPLTKLRKKKTALEIWFLKSNFLHSKYSKVEWGDEREQSTDEIRINHEMMVVIVE